MIRPLSKPPSHVERMLRRDLKTLTSFIELYCHNHHRSRLKQRSRLKTHDVPGIYGKAAHLCGECHKLLVHSFVKRTCCPLDPKPDCKHCDDHCFAPEYRHQIRRVMKDSGRRMLLNGRLNYLLKLWF